MDGEEIGEKLNQADNDNEFKRICIYDKQRNYGSIHVLWICKYGVSWNKLKQTDFLKNDTRKLRNTCKKQTTKNYIIQGRWLW